MPVAFSTFGNIYSNYANANLPWNELHAYSAKLAMAPAGEGNAALAIAGRAVGDLPAPVQQSRATLYAYRAAVVPHQIMRIPDAVFGTGVHKQGGAINITTGNEAVSHISECIRSPFDSGLVGLSQGLSFLRTAAVGAFFGAIIGAAVCAKPESVETCAAAGAMLTAVLFWLPPAVALSIVNGVFRAGTSLAKFAVVGAFYGAGFAVGTLVDRFTAVPVPANA